MPPDENLDEPQLGLDPQARACGNCRIWRAHSRGAGGGWLGDCRLMPQRGLFGPDAPLCGSFISRSQAIPVSMPEAPGRHRSRTIAPAGPKEEDGSAGRRAEAAGPKHFIVRHGALVGAPGAARVRPDIDLGEDFNMTREELKQIFLEALGETQVQLAGRWEGGTVLLKPGNPGLQSKEIPIDALFHKVVMVRDRLRVLEQKINAHPKLTDAEKVDMQQYVTRCYGSLTTFNVLFSDKGDQFVGDRGD